MKSMMNSRNCIGNILKKLHHLHINSRQLYQSSAHRTESNHKSLPRTKLLTDNKKWSIINGPDLSYFMSADSKIPMMTSKSEEPLKHPYLNENHGRDQKVYFDIYGCQMNVNDTEVIWSILQNNKYKRTMEVEDADIVLVVTCAIRDSAEQKVLGRLAHLNSLKKKRKILGNKSPLRIGLLGCMAERLKHNILEKYKMVDIVAGPDAYRYLPQLLLLAENDETAINVALSFDETYADITPVRLNANSISAYVSIMRGCDNMCTYCIVPFVRGRERSRPVSSILEEIRKLSDEGVKEVTLLGQNVNSYRDTSQINFYVDEKNNTKMSKGFRTVYKNKSGGMRFNNLLDLVSQIDPEMRIRFTSPHPKDFPDEVLHLIASRANICKQIHLPAQSGNSVVLERMRRGYTRESYLELVDHVRSIIPTIKLSSDFIVGFCGETDDEFNDTITLIESIQYHMAYLFQYSMREKTTAHRRFIDDVPATIKLQRLQKMMSTFRINAENLNRLDIGTQQLVLIEGPSRRTNSVLRGRNDGNTRVLIPDTSIPIEKGSDTLEKIKPGNYVVVQIYGSNSNSLTGIPLYHSTITKFLHNTK